MKPDAREIAPVNQQEKGLLPIPDKQGPLAVLILTDSGAAAASAFRNCSANRPPRIPRLSPAKLKRSLPIPEKQRFRPSGMDRDACRCRKSSLSGQQPPFRPRSFRFRRCVPSANYVCSLLSAGNSRLFPDQSGDQPHKQAKRRRNNPSESVL